MGHEQRGQVLGGCDKAFHGQRNGSLYASPEFHSVSHLRWLTLRGHCTVTHSVPYVLIYFWKQHSGPKFGFFHSLKVFIFKTGKLFSPMTNTVFSLTAVTHKHHLTLSHERIMSYCKYFNKLHSRKWISSSVFTDRGIFFNSYELNTKTGYELNTKTGYKHLGSYTKKAQKK